MKDLIYNTGNDFTNNSNTIGFSVIGDKFFINLPTELRNSIWSEWYGNIQGKLRNLGDKILNIFIKAEKTEWVDPIPMLSLIISIAEIHKEKNIFYVVPDLDLNALSKGQKRVLEFLEKEGFFTEMIKYNVCIVPNCYYSNISKNKAIFEETSINTTKWIQTHLNGFVYYNNSTILKAKVIDLSSERYQGKIDDTIERELTEVKHRISQHLQDSQLNDILWKIGLFLKETINNVYEHAYGNNPKYVGYYIRHLVGLSDNSLNDSVRKKIDQAFKKEWSDLKRLILEFPKSSTGFIELYVIDSGVGLTENYVSTRGKNRRGKPLARSFRVAWQETIGNGDRADKTKKNTEFGGLYTIGKLLSDDFLLARDYDLWIGDNLPPKNMNGAYISACSKTEENFVKGLALMCRLDIKRPMDNNDWILSEKNSQCFIEAAKEERSIYKKYNELNEKKPSYIKDKRFDLDFMKDDRYLQQETGDHFCFFLPNEHKSKNVIFELVNEIKFLGENKNRSRTVIIADIPVCECGLYQLSIEGASFGEEFTCKVDRIVMISQRLSVLVLRSIATKDGVFYRKSNEDTHKYIENRPNVFSPHLSLLHAIEWLKTHDSIIIWQYIKKYNDTELFFVNKKVEWYKRNEEEELNGYLDFEKTLTDSFIKKVYHHALQRTLCLSIDSECTYTAEDPLMSALSNYMNTLYYNKSYSSNSVQKLIALGSVYVSGATQSSGVTHNINMFLHKDSSKFLKERNTVMHLFAWPEKKLFELRNNDVPSKFPYRRVGSTYAIAPFGWRYFPIPRYKANSSDGTGNVENRYFFSSEEMKGIKFQSIYKCSPKETYNYWQGGNGLFMGISHVDYETKHDVLNINFPFIVKESFMLGGDLASFLLGEVSSALSLKEECLDFDENVKLKENVLEYIDKNKDKYSNRKCSFVVYPYHSNTEQIIDTVKNYIKKGNANFIPLIPLNKERTGTSFQPSPLTIEMLRKTIKSAMRNAKAVNALLLDDAIVEGKTQEEIKHVLYGLGVSHVMSVFILERRRIPYNTSDNTKTAVFWRLDIPRLGHKYSCPLCKALDTISNFETQIISNNARTRIEEWKTIWEAKTENTLERTQTLNPVKIQLPQNTKRFGIYFEDGVCKQCGGDDNRIEILSSLGLTLYMGELLSITFRDDKMLQYCAERYNLDSLTILEMLCTNLLLYGKSISRRVREEIVRQIFDHANKLYPNYHTAFAALVLLTQENEVLMCLMDKYSEMTRSNIRPNYDMLILLSYLSVKIESIFGCFKDAKRLTRISMDGNKPYLLFHSELYNGSGKAHTRAINRLQQGSVSSKQELERCEDALDCLKYSLEHIYDWNLSDWCKMENKISIKEAIDWIAEKKKLLEVSYDDYLEKRYDYCEEFEKLSTILGWVHNRLFIRLNVVHDSCGVDDSKFMLKKMMMGWLNNKKYDIGLFSFEQLNVGFSSNIVEKWIIWDRTVEEELEYLIINANEHSNGVFIPSNYHGEAIAHRVWVSIEYAANYSSLSLLIYNKSNKQKNAEYIKKESEKKSRYGKSRLSEELDIETEYFDKENNIIETKVTFKLI